MPWIVVVGLRAWPKYQLGWLAVSGTRDGRDTVSAVRTLCRGATRHLESPMPLSLSDAKLMAVMEAAKPLRMLFWKQCG